MSDSETTSTMFERAPEYADLLASARRFVRDNYDYAERHAARAGGETLRAACWREMAELGWLGACVSEDAGGLGLPLSVLSELVEALGPAAMPEPLIAQTARSAFLLDHCAAQAVARAALEAWLAGNAMIPFVVGDGGTANTPVTASENGADWQLRGEVADVCDAAMATHLLVPATTPDGQTRLCLVDVAAPGVALASSLSVDCRGVGGVTFDRTPVAADSIFMPDDYAALRAESDLLYALLLASESLGIVRALVARTRDYLAERRQFGQALIEFQALQHRLVDMHLAVVRLESQLVTARVKVDELGLNGTARYIAAARVQADTVGQAVGGEAAQLHGGIGMTDELEVGHHVKRLLGNRLRGGTSVDFRRRLRMSAAAD